MKPNPPYHDQGPQDIGPIEDKWFVFHDDCGKCDVKIATGSFMASSCYPFREYRDEWNLLNNYPGLSRPMLPEAKAVWDNLRVNYEQAKERVASHKVED
jgi:hypothetical protein